MDKNTAHNQKGIGAIIIVIAVVLVIVIAIIVYLMLNPKKPETQTTNPNTSTNQTLTGNDEDVPLKVCETGDPEQCNDPIPNSAVDEVKVDDLP